MQDCLRYGQTSATSSGLKKEDIVVKAIKVFRPKAGYISNPMLSYDRNLPCPCDSGKKFKKCCLRDLAPYVSKATAAQFQLVIEGKAKLDRSHIPGEDGTSF